MCSNYPPGMRESDIPGIDDRDVSYDATFLFEGELDEYQGIFNIPSIAKDWLEVPVKVDWSTLDFSMITMNYSVYVTYSDDLCLDTRHMEYDEIEDAIIEHLNETITERHFSRRDDDLSIDFDIH